MLSERQNKDVYNLMSYVASELVADAVSERLWASIIYRISILDLVNVFRPSRHLTLTYIYKRSQEFVALQILPITAINKNRDVSLWAHWVG